jgi:hypothetical protein
LPALLAIFLKMNDFALPLLTCLTATFQLYNIPTFQQLKQLTLQPDE